MCRQQRKSKVAVCIAIGVCVLAVPALAQDCPELIGRSAGVDSIAAVAVSDRYAYLGSTAGLLIADIADPSAPRIVGEVGLEGGVAAIAVSGTHAYVAAGSAGLRVIDVSTPSAPVEVGFVSTAGWTSGVAVSGGYAYLADSLAGLRVINISTPSAPFEVDYADRPGEAWSVAVSGSYAYVVVHEGLHVIDVSSPSRPRQVGSVDTSSFPHDVAVSGDFAFVAAGAAGLRVIDVSTPYEPVEVASVDVPGTTLGVAVSGDVAYVAAGFAGLRVINVNLPNDPVEVGFVDVPGETLDVSVSGGYAYLAAQSWGLRVIDVSTPSAPAAAGFLGWPAASAHEVAVSDGYAYVVGSGFTVIDVNTPWAPVEVGSVDTPGDTRGVAVAGNYAYVANYDAGVRVIDVSSPSTPFEVGFVDTPGRANGVAVSGGYAYVATDGEGLRVIDVSTPSAPVEVGFVDTPGQVNGVAVSGGYAYVAGEWWNDGAWRGYLRVIDISTRSAPIEVERLDIPGWPEGLAVSGSYAYVAAGHMGLRVIDVSTPSAPVEVGSIGTAGFAQSVAISRGYAYVAVYARGLWVIDVSAPMAPTRVGFVNTPGNAQGVTAGAGYVYLAAGRAGLYVFSECPRTAPDDRQSFIPAAAVAAGAQGAFFQTDLEINNTGTEEAQLTFQWLPRGQDNSAPIQSEPIALAPGQSLRYENVLTELFSLGPDSVGALKLLASTPSVIGMSRTYNSPEGKAAGTYGQGLPAIRTTEMIVGAEPRRIIFLSENPDSRANVGCLNGSSEPVRINIAVFDADGDHLETKAMGLGPYSNGQINRVFQDYAPLNGFVEVWADSDQALYYCYGSMLDSETSDPTTILPQVPSADVTFIPAAALAAGLEGSFFQIDVDLNNTGSTDITYQLVWLPRGADNSNPVRSGIFSLAPNAGVRYANVLDEVFGLGPDQVGALAVDASETELLAMSRTYNLPSGKVAGTFGQELPGIPADRMIASRVTKRIIFLSENDHVRSNLGCVNGVGTETVVEIDLHDSQGVELETTYMMLPPYSNRQINGIFRDYAPVNGYVDVRTYTPDATFYCYGSVLDNATSDPTTVLPQ